MDENDIQQLQEELASALIDGNKEKEREISSKIDSLFQKAPPVEPEKQEEVHEEPAEQAVPEAVEANGEQANTTDDAQGGKEAPPSSANTDEAATRANTEAEDNWLDSLEPAIRAHAEKLLEDRKRLEQENQKLYHRFKSDDGRVAAYQRRYDELQKKLVRLEEENRSFKHTTATPHHQQTPQASQAVAAKQIPPANNDEVDQDLQALMEVDEQLARVILRQRKEQQERVAQLEQRLEKLSTEIAPLHDYREEQHIQSELQKLQGYYENATEILRSDHWREWVEVHAAPGVARLANSDRADDVASAMNLYGMWVMENFPNQFQQDGAPATTTTQQTVDPRADAVRKERERKLNAQPVGSANIKPPSKTAPTQAEILADPELLAKKQEEIFNEEMKKLGLA